MTFLLIAIVLLLAAILITLLTAWKIIGIVLGCITALAAAIYVLDALFGKSGVEAAVWVVVALLFGLAFWGWAAEKRDKERPPNAPPVKKLTAAERRAELTALREKRRRDEAKSLSRVERLDGDALDRVIWNRERDLE